MKTFTTSDLSLAAFIKLKGIKLVSAQKGQGGKFFFEFVDNGSIESLVIEFANSDFAAYDANLRALKKAVNTRSK